MTNLAHETLFSSNTQPENERLALLKQHFPNCFDKNGAFLPEKMAEELHAKGVATQKEGYSLNWLGKSYAKVLRDLPPETLLVEHTAHNRLPENANSENILIKGDNLEVLKHLKHAYKNQIKMIYIDPPYNTGSDDFVYQDNRKFTPEQLAELGGMDLDEAKRVLEFTAKKSNSHSAWLTFMYPRLYIARELLRDDGVIFISIDGNEVSQLKILCDEIFGESNVEQYVWNLSDFEESSFTKTASHTVRFEHEYIIACYKKNKSLGRYKEYRLLDRTDLTNADNDPRGEWFSGNISRNGITSTTGSKYFTITTPTGIEYSRNWTIDEDEYKTLLADNKIYFGKDGNGVPRLKMFKTDAFMSIQSSIFSGVKTSISGKNAIKELFDDMEVFSFPKPIELIHRLASITIQPKDLILDFFAGSGTTAHAVMQLNTEDNGNRRFICVQLPEKTDEKSEAHKAGYQTIFDITKARIEKAAAKIQTENPDYTGDLGFKIFQTEPNFQTALDVDFDPAQTEIPDSKNAMLSDEQLHTLLTTWRVYDGCRLPENVQPIDLAGYTAYYCRQHLYLLASGFSSECVKALIEKLDNDKDFIPERIVLFGENMDSAMQKELAQAVKTYANKKGLNNLSVLARY
ncbi:site-specific DNA-methyltransferase [Kingella kingae]|nr:site-specific DNA-methyltransferase [Kingella kingae]MDK4535260.1 site-specific DNA-methyltransferase [Kingella kingae]MDK4541766.1 site-specific DNA-methyltransferase [Kingella kingae]MDK4554286.1 site-specific DNA-methyltransferase [Kingella kingae]MDK4581346.1 site-specific DNA-methyltransferase [Kingella kingae]UOP03332.1 site-specific DNA-methyltransferase [Kingella kingae]